MSARVHARHVGARVAIGAYGDAVLEETRDEEGKVTLVDRPCTVPDEVALELAGRPDLRVEGVDPAAAAARRAWHSEKGDVHHTEVACKLGNNVEAENRIAGTGDKPLCQECARIVSPPALSAAALKKAQPRGAATREEQ